MKFNLKCCTFIIIILTAGLASEVFAKEISLNQGAESNSDFKNYNRILEISDSNNKKTAIFKVFLADSDKKRSHGLMNLKYLPADHGMIFTFFPSREIAMWMKNTFIALDMIFIDANNRIITIAENTIPHSLEVISSQKKAAMVLEINAGLVKKLGLKIGQKIKVLNQN
jgi:uncharacterized membrane protein (UPF0127 family)